MLFQICIDDRRLKFRFNILAETIISFDRRKGARERAAGIVSAQFKGMFCVIVQDVPADTTARDQNSERVHTATLAPLPIGDSTGISWTLLQAGQLPGR